MHRDPGYKVTLLSEHGDRQVCVVGSGGTLSVGTWRGVSELPRFPVSCVPSSERPPFCSPGTKAKGTLLLRPSGAGGIVLTYVVLFN